MKRVIAVAVIVVMFFTTSAFAEKRAFGNLSRLNFDDSEAKCYVRLVYPEKTIKATVKLYEDKKLVDSWSNSGNGRVVISGSHDADGGKTYTLKITGTADGKAINISPVSKVSPTEVSSKIPAKVVITSTTSKSNGFTMAWGKAKKAKKYQVAYKIYGTKKWTKKITSKLKFTVSGKPFTKYSFKVRAINGSKYGKWSDIRTLTTKLTKPVISVSQQGTKVTVKWKKIAGAKKYKVEYKIKGSAEWTYKSLSKCQFSFEAKEGKTYIIRVKAANEKVSSIWSAAKTVKVINRTSFITYSINANKDDNPYASNSEEYPLWSYEKLNPHKRDNAPENITVSINNENYVGNYSFTSVEQYSTYETDFYTFDGGMFSINNSTGELLSYLIINSESGDLTEQECREIALDEALKYINVKSYDLKIDETDKAYNYLFTRKIDGINTCEILSITVSKAGVITQFSKRMIDEFDKAILNIGTDSVSIQIADLISEEATNSINSFLEINYPDYTYQIKRTMLVITEDEEIGLIYSVEITKESNDSDDEVQYWEGDLIDVLIKCN